MYGSWKATLGNETIRLVNVLISLARVTDEQRSAETRAITAGRDASGALFPPLHAASTWDAGSLDGTHAGAKAIHQVGFYSRYANPTVDAFERAIAELEGTESALAFASGMGAISSVIFGFCSTGDHIVAQRNMYAGTLGVLNGPCRRMGIDVTFVDGRNADEFAAAVRPGKTMLIVAESPSNPHLDLVDLEKLGAISGPITMIDSTVATSLGQRPADFGIDLVVHSATKGIAGHNDATLGVVAGSKDYIDALWSYSVLHGATASPHDALAGLRGLRTLPVRLDRQSGTAEMLAEWFSSRPQVTRVNYPGLATHPQHHLAATQMRRFGALLSIELAGGTDACRRFIDALTLARPAVTLGGPDTLVSHSTTSTHLSVDAETKAATGITDGLIRISVGLEDPEDLRADFARGLSALL